MDIDLKGLLLRIDRLESRHVMRDLVTDYCRGFDQRNFDRFLAKFLGDIF